MPFFKLSPLRLPLTLPACLCAWLVAVVALAAELPPVKTLAASADRVSARPDYAHALAGSLSWVQFGMESRTRYERRWYDYATRDLLSDDALVTRNLLWLGVTERLDPLRLYVEVEDSRRFFSEREKDANVETGLELLQAFAQLHLEDALADLPLDLNIGRMAFDFVDRRLVARNRNRNTINAFDGIRLRLGGDVTRWEVDAFAVQPVERIYDARDQAVENIWLAGMAGHWRGHSPQIILEPYWLWLNQDNDQTMPMRRDLHTLGIHVFGRLGKDEAWDYDVSVAGQWGRAQGGTHRAWAAHVEAGRSFASAWRPRLALWVNYATGDTTPGDGKNQRFDPLFGASYAMYGFSGWFIWRNLVNPTLRLTFQPAARLRCELAHRAYWLDSSTDAWTRGLRRDRTGRSGSYVGQESDARLVWLIRRNLDLDLAYARFWPGGFTQGTGVAPDSHFFQAALTLKF